MKTVKSTATTDLEIGFEGSDYKIPAGALVACEDEVADFIKETCPLFEVERLSVGKAGDEIPRIEKKPSKVYVQQKPPEQSMFVSKNKVDDTVPPTIQPDGIDQDGVEWVGGEVEKDSLS